MDLLCGCCYACCFGHPSDHSSGEEDAAVVSAPTVTAPVVAATAQAAASPTTTGKTTAPSTALLVQSQQSTATTTTVDPDVSVVPTTPAAASAYVPETSSSSSRKEDGDVEIDTMSRPTVGVAADAESSAEPTASPPPAAAAVVTVAAAASNEESSPNQPHDDEADYSMTITIPNEQQQAPAGSTVLVTWEGPEKDTREGDYLGVVVHQTTSGHTTTDGTACHNSVSASTGSPAPLLLPVDPGKYEIQYFGGRNSDTVLGRTSIVLTRVEAALMTPLEAAAGSTISIPWEGPNYEGDFIGIGLANGKNHDYGNFVYVAGGSPSDLVMPSEPGPYVIKYFLGQGERVLTLSPITVHLVQSELVAVREAVAGSTISVKWNGPTYNGDFLGISLASARDQDYGNYVYTSTNRSHGDTHRLILPVDHGKYVIKYFLGQGDKILAQHPIHVTPVKASISTVDDATAGSSISVTWNGPAYEGDFLGVCLANTRRNNYGNYVYTAYGNPSELILPTDPGKYIIKYFLGQGDKAIAKHKITVSPVKASLTAPSTAPAGSTVSVEWTGPGYDSDFIGVALATAKGREYSNYVYTSSGSPVDLQLPAEAGNYVIKYFLGQEDTVLTKHAINVTSLQVSLTTVSEALAGATIAVEWDGPAYETDFIGVSLANARKKQYTNYKYTSEGNPSSLVLPTQPGRYAVKYFMGQGETVLAQHEVKVADVVATLSTVDEASVGSTISVDWTGPEYESDFIGISLSSAHEKSYTNYVFVSDGSPVDFELPGKAGSYALKYFLGQGERVIGKTIVVID